MSYIDVLFWVVAKLLKNRTIKRPITKYDIKALHVHYVLTQTLCPDAKLPPFSSLGIAESTAEIAEPEPAPEVAPEPAAPAAEPEKSKFIVNI